MSEADELRALLREAHGVIGDLRREIREARAVVPTLAKAEIDLTLKAMGPAIRDRLDTWATEGFALMSQRLEEIRQQLADEILRTVRAFDREVLKQAREAGLEVVGSVSEMNEHHRKMRQALTKALGRR